MITVLRGFSRQFAALATDYAHKYRYDPFLRTEVHTIALLVLFALFLLVSVGASTYFLYHDVTSVMSEAISESIRAEAPPWAIGENVVAKLEELQFRNITLLSFLVIGVTIIAGYIVARVVLSPTRNALEMQKQFIANVAHELRTPLSNIKTTSEVALMDRETSTSTREILTSTVEELNRISDIINNLLSLSASVRPERIEFQDEDLGTIVENSVRTLRRLAQPKKIGMTVRMSERRLVWGNAVALEQIVTNILKNAVMYTPPGGGIAVTVEPVYPDFIELTIRDSGMGIARDDLFRIFEPYYRAEKSRNRAQDKSGGGLGLSIVSELVKLHGGKITVRSVESQGTTVVVLFPAGKDYPRSGDKKRHDREDMSEIAMDFSRSEGGAT